MSTVIDFGEVDWGKIWGDRAKLVTPEHLRDLNAIDTSTHLRHPGYWRNLFSSYPEVVSRAGQISDTYTPAGKKAQTQAFQFQSPSLKPNAMNAFTAKQRDEAFNQRKENDKVSQKYLEENPRFNRNASLGDQFLDTLRHAPVVKQVVDVEQKVERTAGVLIAGAEHIVTGVGDNITTISYAAVGAVAVAGLILLSR